MRRTRIATWTPIRAASGAAGPGVEQPRLPYKCIFCVWPATMTGNDPDGTAKRTVRHYGPDYMEAFLTEIVGKYGYRSIYFDDDTFNLGSRACGADVRGDAQDRPALGCDVPGGYQFDGTVARR